MTGKFGLGGGNGLETSVVHPTNVLLAPPPPPPKKMGPDNREFPYSVMINIHWILH